MHQNFQTNIAILRQAVRRRASTKKSAFCSLKKTFQFYYIFALYFCFNECQFIYLFSFVLQFNFFICIYLFSYLLSNSPFSVCFSISVMLLCDCLLLSAFLLAVDFHLLISCFYNFFLFPSIIFYLLFHSGCCFHNRSSSSFCIAKKDEKVLLENPAHLNIVVGAFI